MLDLYLVEHLSSNKIERAESASTNICLYKYIRLIWLKRIDTESLKKKYLLFLLGTPNKNNKYFFSQSLMRINAFNLSLKLINSPNITVIAKKAVASGSLQFFIEKRIIFES